MVYNIKNVGKMLGKNIFIHTFATSF
jgi:hypothetical protein